jgi:hypothetical protein
MILTKTPVCAVLTGTNAWGRAKGKTSYEMSRGFGKKDKKILND